MTQGPLRPVPAGTVFYITTGEYSDSDYSVTGVFKAKKELNFIQLKMEYLTEIATRRAAGEKHKWGGEIRPDDMEFIAYCFKKGDIEIIDSLEVHIDSLEVHIEDAGHSVKVDDDDL